MGKSFQSATQGKTGFLGAVFFGVLVLYGITEIIAGWVGIHHAFGTGWALAALLVGFFFLFSLPMTVGAFLCALNVWDWHWIGALLFASPGLVIMPILISADVASWFRHGKENGKPASQKLERARESQISPMPEVDLNNSTDEWLVCEEENEILWFWLENHRVIDPSEAGVYTKKEALKFLGAKNMKEDTTLNGFVLRHKAVNIYEGKKREMRRKNRRADFISLVLVVVFFLWVWSTQNGIL